MCLSLKITMSCHRAGDQIAKKHHPKCTPEKKKKKCNHCMLMQWKKKQLYSIFYNSNLLTHFIKQWAMQLFTNQPCQSFATCSTFLNSHHLMCMSMLVFWIFSCSFSPQAIFYPNHCFFLHHCLTSTEAYVCLQYIKKWNKKCKWITGGVKFFKKS